MPFGWKLLMYLQGPLQGQAFPPNSDSIREWVKGSGGGGTQEERGIAEREDE